MHHRVSYAGPVRFTEAELTVAITSVAKAALRAQSKDIRKGRVELEDAWRELGGYGRYQLLEPIGSQLLPILVSLPDLPRVHGERPKFSTAQIKDAVEQHVGDEGGRLRRRTVVLARTALLHAVLAELPPWIDPDHPVEATGRT